MTICGSKHKDFLIFTLPPKFIPTFHSRFHRTMTRPFFSRERISDFELFDTHWSKAMSALRQRCQENEAVDFQDLVGRFTLDSATDFVCPFPFASLVKHSFLMIDSSSGNASNPSPHLSPTPTTPLKHPRPPKHQVRQTPSQNHS